MDVINLSEICFFEIEEKKLREKVASESLKFSFEEFPSGIINLSIIKHIILSPSTLSNRLQGIVQHESSKHGNGRTNNQRPSSGREAQLGWSRACKVGLQSDHRGDDRTQEEALRL